MNVARTLLFMIIVYSVISIIFVGIGESVTSEEDGEWYSSVSGQDEIYEAFNTKLGVSENGVSYYDLLIENAELAGIDDFKLGEYDLSSLLHFDDVKIYNKSVPVDDKVRTESSNVWVTFINKIILNKLHYPSQISDADMTNLSYGEEIWVYPKISFKYDANDISITEMLTGFIHPNLWIVVGLFSVDSEQDVFLDVDPKFFGASYTFYQRIYQLNGGKMPKTDFYYCIDCIVTDVDLTGWSYDEIVNYLQPSGKAEVIERYGGVIYGDVGIPEPDRIAAHTLALEKQNTRGTWGGILNTINMWKAGYDTCTGASMWSNDAGGIIMKNIVNMLFWMPIIFITGLIVYSETKDWIGNLIP